MVKKLILLGSTLLLFLMMVGCSVSLDSLDDVMNLITSDQNSNDNKANEDAGQENKGGDKVADKNDEKQNESEDNGGGDSEGNSENVNSDEAGQDKNKVCDDDYSDIVELLPGNFPIPDCSFILEITNNKNESREYSYVFINMPGNWKDLFELYLNFFGEDGYTEINEHKQPVENRASITAYKESESYMYIEFRTKDDGTSDVKITYELYEY